MYSQVQVVQAGRPTEHRDVAFIQFVLDLRLVDTTCSSDCRIQSTTASLVTLG